MSNHEVTLKTSSDLGGQPTVSLMVTVKPDHKSASAVLNALAPHVDEVIVVEVGDHPDNSLKRHPALSTKPGAFIKVDEKSHPELFAKDVPETFAIGTSLANEVCSWPFTNESFVADWSAVRSLGWNLCTQDWKVVLDGDEMVANPAYLIGVCHELESLKAGLAFIPHLRTGVESGDKFWRERTSLRWMGRLCRNDNVVGWKGVASETLEGMSKTALIEGSLATYKIAPHDYYADGQWQFKALYANARKSDWDVSPADLLYMAKTSKYVGMEDFGCSAIDLYLKTSLYTEERAWACALRGEIMEARLDYDGAVKWYKRSLTEHPGHKSAYRLCRVLFKQAKWRECIDAFEAGFAHNSFAHMIDDGTETYDRAYILVVGAYKQLGLLKEAKAGSQALRRLFPNNTNIHRFCVEMEG
jgi:hypothetical protein